MARVREEAFYHNITVSIKVYFTDVFEGGIKSYKDPEARIVDCNHINPDFRGI